MRSLEARYSPETPQSKLDAIVVLGKNIGVGWGPKEIRDSKNSLSDHSIVSVCAAGILYKAGLTDKIIFATGKTAGTDVPSEAEAMKRKLKALFPLIPNSAIILEERSKDTASNAKEVKKIIDRNGLREIGLVTVGFHLERATILFGREGIKVSTLVASEVALEAASPQAAEKYLNSNSALIAKEERKEKIARLLQSVPGGSLLLRSVVLLTRKS